METLTRELPKEAIFFDRLNILPSQDFRLCIYQAISAADLVIVVIGQTWLTEFKKRQEGADNGINEDQVLVEIETALRLGKTVLPLRINGAKVPENTELPSTIKGLARLNMKVFDPGDQGATESFSDDVSAVLRLTFQERLERISKRTGISPKAFELVLEGARAASLDAFNSSRMVTGADIWEGVKLEGKKVYGDHWQTAMKKLGLRQSESLSAIIYCLILDGVVDREHLDEPADFWGLGSVDA